MRIFGFEIKKVTVGERTVSNVYMMPWDHNQQYIPPPDDFKAQVDEFRSWVYICASKNATSVANSTLRLYVRKKNKNQKLIVPTREVTKAQLMSLRKNPGLQKYFKQDANIEEVTEHISLDLLEEVNPLINRFDLWELTEIYLELTGNAYWYLPKNGLEVPAEIWPIPVQNMRIVPGKSNLIKGYVYKYGTVEIPFEPEEIIHFKFPSPTSQLYGMSPLVAIQTAVSFEKNTRRYEDTLMKNNARPEAILETENIVGEREYERLKEQWQQNYGGPMKVGKTIILEKGLTYKAVTLTNKDIGYMEGRRVARDEIAAAYGIPLSKLTTESVNLANARVGEWQYKKDTLEPRLRRIEEKLNEKFIPLFDSQLFFAYDTPVPEDETFELTEQRTHLGSYVTSINEEREKMGMEPVGWGNKPLVPANIVPLGEAPPVQPGMQNPSAAPKPPGRDQQPASGPNEPKPPAKPPNSPPDKNTAKIPTDEEIESFAKKLTGAIKRHLEF